MHPGPASESPFSLTGRAQSASDELRAAGIAHPLLKAECLLEYLTGIPRLEHPLHPEYHPAADEEAAFHAGIRRLTHGEPLQYVIGIVFVADDVLPPQQHLKGGVRHDGFEAIYETIKI